MFSQEEKVVYPGHGVARICRVIEKNVGGQVSRFFELRFLNKDMVILVPVDNAESLGIRRLASRKNVNDVLSHLGRPFEPACVDPAASNWNKRNKEYQGRIRSGDLRQIGEIYRSLKFISQRKELSFGEKKLLSQTETLLAEEIALVKNVVRERATQELRSIVK